MLRNTCIWWGRWNSRDFLKGRGKKAGAIHVRHTHGSKGRYKRLSDMYGIRDGRRHAQNTMKGGLGIKLGGGLFGLRMPRQHLLSTMTREQLDLELYGHPNITNPYRDLMDEHPDLKAVMESAHVVPHLVVLLPRVKRDFSSARASHSSAPADVPAAWQQVGEELTELFASFFLTSQVLLCTLDASVEVSLGAGTLAPPSSTPEETATQVHAALSALYKQHCRTGTRLVEEKSSSPRRHRKPSLALFGAEMQRPTASDAPRYTSAALAKLIHEAPPVVRREPKDREAPAKGQGVAVSAKGVSDLVHEFRERFPDALCVCLRPSAIAAPPELDTALPAETPSVPSSTPEEARGHAALQQLKAVLEKGKAKNQEGHRPSRASVDGDDVAHARKERQLLKADVDPDTQKGVWATPPTAHLGELLRWQYANRDPRAHSGDSVPHKARRLPCVLLVDLSKQRSRAGLPSNNQRREKDAPQQRVQSLLPDEVSNALVTLRYVPVKSAYLEETLAELRQWHVEASWNRMLNLQHRKHDTTAAHSS